MHQASNHSVIRLLELLKVEYYSVSNFLYYLQAIDGSMDDFGDNDDDEVRATKKSKKRKKRGSVDDDEDEDDPPVSYSKKKRGASSGVGLDKIGEQKLKRQCRKIMDIVIKYVDRYGCVD